MIKPPESEGLLKDKKVASLLLENPYAHSYSLGVISSGIQLLLYALTSLRGARKCFEIFPKDATEDTPTSVSIQNWLLKLGLYELQNDKPYRQDKP